MFIFASLINLKKLNDMRRIDLLKFAICVMAVCALAMFNSGCEKENLNDLKQPTSVKKPRVISDDEIMKDLPEVKDGRLLFKDMKEFYSMLDWVSQNQANPDKIYSIFGLSNFVSMNYIYTTGNRLIQGLDESNFNEKMQSYIEYVQTHPYSFYNLSNNEECFYEMQAPSVISYIANEYGLYQIGDSIYRVSYEKEYIITDGNEDMINIVLSGVENPNYDNIIIKCFKGNVEERSLNSEYITPINPDKRRVKIRFYTTESSGKWEYDVRVTTQKKVLGAWVNGVGFDDTQIGMNKNNSYWYISGVQYRWRDANVWKVQIAGISNYRFTAIITPSSIPVSMGFSYVPYEISGSFLDGTPISWSHENVFAYNSGWNK